MGVCCLDDKVGEPVATTVPPPPPPTSKPSKPGQLGMNLNKNKFKIEREVF
jgi:hypothetical protein